MVFRDIYEYYTYLGRTDKKAKTKKKNYLNGTVASNLNKKLQDAYNKGYNKNAK